MLNVALTSCSRFYSSPYDSVQINVGNFCLSNNLPKNCFIWLGVGGVQHVQLWKLLFFNC